MAARADPKDGRPSSFRALFRSRRSKAEPSSPLTVSRVSDAVQPAGTARPSSSPVGSAALSPPVSTHVQGQAPPAALTPVATRSAPQPSQPVPSSPQAQRDLWGDAAATTDPQVLAKLQPPESTPGSTDCRSVTEVLGAAKERARTQQSKVWKQRWISLVKSVSTFKSLIDAGLQFDPTGYGALAWSVVSFGFEAAISNTEIEAYLVESCEYIRAVIDEYSMYEARYLDVASQGRKALEKGIVEVYKAVISYAAEVNYYTEHRADRIGKAVKGSSDSSFIEFKSLIEDRRIAAGAIIADIRNELSEARINSIQQGIDAVLAKADDIAKITRFVDEEARQKILSWVSVMQMDTEHVTQRDKAEAGDRQSPGMWLLHQPEYLQWERADKTTSFWLCSGVGTGKTIITSTVIEARRKLGTGPVAYFYCSGASADDATQMTAENILKCLLKQFAACSEAAFAHVAAKWKDLQSSGLRPLTRLEVLTLMRVIIEDEHALEATIIVDGLDELAPSPLKILLDSLATLRAGNCGILKLFASSRWVQRIEDILADGFGIDDIAHETRHDMEIFIETALKAEARGRHSLDKSLIEEIRTMLLERAHGMFRYIELAIKYLFESTTQRIRDRLETLPHPASGDAVLRPMYEKLYREIETDDPIDQLIARRTIQWLLHQIVPLTDEGLCDAISYGIEDEVSAKLRNMSFGIDEVKAACHHLVIHNPAASRFEFGHVSVVEFIRWKDPPALSVSEAHAALATACLSQLTQKDSSKRHVILGGARTSSYSAAHPRFGSTRYDENSTQSRGYSSGRSGLDKMESDDDSASSTTGGDSENRSEPENRSTLENRNESWDFEKYSVMWWTRHWREVGQHHPSSTVQAVFDAFWGPKSHFQAWVEKVYVLSRSIYFGEYLLFRPGAVFAQGKREWRMFGPVLQRWVGDYLQLRWLVACAHDFADVAEALLRENSVHNEQLLFVPGIKVAVAFGSTRVLEITNCKFFPFSQLHAMGTSLLHHAAYLQQPASIQKCLELVPEAVSLCAGGVIKEKHISTPFLMWLRAAAQSRSQYIFGVESTPAQIFLDHPQLDLSVTDARGCTAIYLAMLAGLDQELIAILLQRCPEALFRRDIDGRNCLTMAYDVLDHAGRRNALISVLVYKYPSSDLHTAARTGDTDVLETLLRKHNQRGPDAHDDLLQALFLTAEHETIECMQILLSSPWLDVNDQDEDGFSALMLAAMAGKIYAVNKLLALGADFLLEASTGRNAVYFSIAEKRRDIFKRLLNCLALPPFDINHRDSRTGRTALHYLCEPWPADRYGEVDWKNGSERIMLDEILARRPDLNRKDHEGNTPLDIARANHDGILADLLLAAAAGVRPSPIATRTVSYQPPPVVDDRDIRSFFSFESRKSLCWLLANEQLGVPDLGYETGSDSSEQMYFTMRRNRRMRERERHRAGIGTDGQGIWSPGGAQF